MLPEGWIERTVGELGRVVTGNTPSTAATASYARGVPFVTPGDLGATRDITKGERTVTLDGIPAARVVAAGSTLVTCIGSTIGKTGLAAVALATNQQINAVVPNDSVDSQFLYYQLEAASEQLKALAGTQAVPIVNKSTFSSIPLRLPKDVTEQRRIASVVATWDRALSTAKTLLHNRREQWQALLALTLKAPPANPDADCDNGGYPASVQPGIPSLPATPEGWQRISLARHLTEVRRPASLNTDETYRLVTVRRSRGGVELRETLTGREIKTSTQFYVRTGDFLISKRQIVHGACGIVPAGLDGAVVSNEYAVLNSDGQIDLRFLRYLSESRYFQQTCFHSSIGVHVEKMIFKTERWLKWPFNIPPLPVQLRIVEVLDTARREVELIAAQIERLKQEKAALTADLLTGKRRVRLPAAETTP